MTEKNLCGKTRKVENPYEIWKHGLWEWRVLKKYQRPGLEAENAHARWFCAVKSPMTWGSFEYGDVYTKEIKGAAVKVYDSTTDNKEKLMVVLNESKDN